MEGRNALSASQFLRRLLQYFLVSVFVCFVLSVWIDCNASEIFRTFDDPPQLSLANIVTAGRIGEWTRAHSILILTSSVLCVQYGR